MATYKPLQSVVLTNTSTGVTFSNIDQNYTDLVVVFNGTATSDVSIGLQFNGDTSTSLYSYTRMFGDGSSSSSDRETSRLACYFGIIGSSQSTATAHISNYSSTTINKTVVGRGNSGSYISEYVSLWRNTNAITSITVVSNTFSAGSTFDLYGIKSGAPQALGGDVVTTDGNYWYHLFTTTGSFTPLQNLSADVLAIAGGAGGGADRGAGGGAGGLLYLTSQTLSAGAKTVQVGGGGAGGSGGNSPGAAGTNSFVGSLTAAVGGGSGTGGSGGNGGNGGSGGGGGGTQGGNFTGGTATSGQGNAGGNGRFDAGSIALGSGGGGGAGAAGANGTTSSGAGGTGVNTYSSWITATGSVVGTGGYICGGGGGGSNSGGGSAGAGGTGGGGAGGSGGAGSAATVRTGSGGGGGSNSGGQSPGGAGASGFVIVRYPV
jgi:hypothetical protein